MPSRRLSALLIGLAAAGLSLVHAALPDPGYSDFADLYRGAVLAAHGINPYPAIRAIHPDVALYYPPPALLLILPLTGWNQAHAEAIFVGVGMGLLAFAGYGSPLLIACLSASAIANVIVGQWSPVLTASAVLPSLGFLWAAKPSIGLALAVSYPKERAITLAAVLTIMGVLVWPDWWVDWYAGLSRTVHVAPILRPGGFLLLLALIRWRQPEARLLAALSCIPQTGMLYDTVPLFLIPRTRWEAYGLAALSQIAAVLCAMRVSPDMSLIVAFTRNWPVLLLCLYLPALILVLIRDPRLSAPPASHGTWDTAR